SVTNDGGRIFVRQIDGGRATLLSGDLGGDHSYPRWSPDQSRISFIANNTIYVVPALTGGTPKRLVSVTGLGPIGTHSWSRDGTQIVYGDGAGLWLMPVNGGTPKQIVKGTYLHSPALSPNGQLIAFAEGRRPQFNNVSTNI